MNRVVEMERFATSEPEFVDDARQLAAEAESFLRGFAWCQNALERYVGLLRVGIVGVFLFRIVPARLGVDERRWVIVGDLPRISRSRSARIHPVPWTARIGAMETWVGSAANGRSVAGLIPVNLAATPENAELLAARLSFLDRKILCDYEADLKEGST